MAGAAWSLHKDDGDRLYPRITEKCQDLLSRLVSLEPRELCSEAIVEKCRATRDLRSCGRTVEHSLTSCNHASLCAECGQRCDVCPICRAPIRRHGPPMRTRLYEEFCEAGLITEDRRERDGHLNADVQRLWSFFDVALEYKLVSVICHYVSDVCMDDRAVSSHAIVSMLLDGTVVKDWCKRTFLHIIRSLHDIYCLGTMHMRSKEGVMERFATKLLGLSQILESLEGPILDATSAPIFELQQLIEGAWRVSQHLDVMCWCAKHHFLENLPSSHPSLNDWRSAVKGRKLAANSRAWPEHTMDVPEVASYTSATLFIEDAMSNAGFGRDNDSTFLWENLELGCLRQATASTPVRRREGIGGQSSIRFSAALYPPESVRAAVDIIFLEASADLFLAKKAIFLYYLFDRHWPNHDDEWKQLLDDYVLTFDFSRHAMLESRVFFLLDEINDAALEEACCLLPEVVSCNIHPKVARVLLERQKPHVALDVLHCSNGDGSFRPSGSVEKDEIPALQDAVTAVRVRLECGLLTDAYLYQRSYISRVKSQTQKHVASKSKIDGEDDSRDWSSEMELLVGEVCQLCIRKNVVAKLLELPWHADEEKIFVKCLLEQATRDPCSTAGSLMVVFYIMRCRNREAYLVHKRLSTIERSFLDHCSDTEKSETVRSICAQRTTLVEKGVELLPQIQQDQLRAGSLDQLLPHSTEGKGAALELPSLNPIFPAVQAEMCTSASIPFDGGKCDSLLLSHRSSPELLRQSGWGNYRQPSILHGRAFKATSGVSDVLSHLNIATNIGVTPQKEYTARLSSPILGKKLIYNAENEFTPSSTRNRRAPVAQDAKGKTHDNGHSFLFPTSNSSSSDMQEYNGGAELVLPSENSESDVHKDDGRMVFNERVQNGASFLDENGPAAVPLFRWSENGAVEKRESSRNDKMLDLTTKGNYRPRRQMILSSPNGKRKAHDQPDVCLHDATPGDVFFADNLQMTASEQHKGLLSSGADTNNAYTRRKNGVRWRTEDDSLDSPPPMSGGRIKAFTGIGRASSGSRAFRSHAL